MWGLAFPGSKPTTGMSPHLLLLSVLTGIWSGPLHAEAPDTALAPVKLVVPAAPGSLTDPVARVVSQGMSRKDGRRWVVENHPGAGGAIAFRAIANAKTDGSVLMLTANNFAILPALDKNKTPSFAREFSVIGMVGRSENLLVASPASRTRDIDELIAKSKGNASPLTYTSPLPGSAAHLTMELLRRSVQINLVHVPFTNPSLGVANTVGHFAVIIQPTAGLACFRITHVAMHDRRPRARGCDGAVRDLFRAAGHMGAAVLRTT